ncbi:MAG: histidinol dehydrogenase, partial [Pseudomonadota bacterium]
SELTTEIPGGKAGHTIEPIEHAGCYAPAGRYALPSTVMMTAVTARVAGCKKVTVASPNPSDMILATAAVSGADCVLAVGGAQAIAAMAYGFEDLDPCDLIAGPGNRFVTAAKKLVHGDCGIDMIAGPSELVLVADESAEPATIAADLLGQAEHDEDARPFLITTSASLADAVIVHSLAAVDPVCKQFRITESRVHVVPHPRYDRPRDAALTREDARVRLGLDSDEMIFGFAGMIRPYKGLEELCEVFRGLGGRGARLVIGGGPIDEAYGTKIQSIADSVEMIEGKIRRLDDTEHHDLLTASDVMVLPYRSILTSGALVHAMTVGRSVIGPRIGVFEELIGNEGGLLYDVNGTRGLSVVLDDAIARRSELDMMGKRNGDLAMGWSPSEIARQTLGIIESVRRR